MKKSELLLCHEDEAYALRLSQYLRGEAWQVQIFTRPEPLREKLEEMEETGHARPALLLITPALLLEMARFPSFCEPVLLSNEKEEGAEGLPVIYQYQKAADIARQLEKIAGEGGYGNMRAPREGSQAMREAEVIGVYSPVGRSGKTILALSMGQIAAEKRKTLYLNLEDYHGFARLAGRGGGMDLSDLIYRMRQNGGSIAPDLGGALRSFGKLDYIQPAASACDIRDVRIGEWKELVKQIALEGGYEVIILDMGTQIEEVKELLALCRIIYVPTVDDPWAAAKLAQMLEELEMTGWQTLKERMQPVRVPAPGREDADAFPEGLLQTKAGSYARMLLSARKPGSGYGSYTDSVLY